MDLNDMVFGDVTPCRVCGGATTFGENPCGQCTNQAIKPTPEMIEMVDAWRKMEDLISIKTSMVFPNLGKTPILLGHEITTPLWSKEELIALIYHLNGDEDVK